MFIKIYILIFLLLSCEENHEYKVDENRNPIQSNYFFTNKINDSLFVECYYNGFSSELYLTDSINYRIFTMHYIFEYGQRYKFNNDSNKILFYCQFPKEENYKLEKRCQYTFEELKTKNNLRKAE